MRKIATESQWRVWPKSSQVYICPVDSTFCYGDFEIEKMKCGCPKHAPGFWDEYEDGTFKLRPAKKRGFKDLIS